MAATPPCDATRPRVRLGASLVAAIALVVIAAAGCSPAEGGETSAAATGLPRATAVIGSLPPIEVEVADADAARATGLMHRYEVPPGTGMVFVYEEPVDNPFWMGNVSVPLSIVWSREGTAVGVAEMEPCPQADSTCTRYSPGAPFDLAVETTGGVFTDAGIDVGDRVTVSEIDLG